MVNFGPVYLLPFKGRQAHILGKEGFLGQRIEYLIYQNIGDQVREYREDYYCNRII